jgi:hypothetical protein
MSDIYEVLDAVRAVIKRPGPANRQSLARAIDACVYDDDFPGRPPLPASRELLPGDFYWAIGPQAWQFLRYLVVAIDAASRPEAPIERRRAATETNGAA